MRLAITCLLAAGVLPGQVPRVGSIDFYGLRKIPEERVRQSLGFREGAVLPPSKLALEERIAAIPGVVRAHVEATCCDEGKVILYIGVEEKGASHFDYRLPPEPADIVLPEEIITAYREFLMAVNEAARNGDTAEDFSQGHSLMVNAAGRELQKRFIGLAAQHLEVLRGALRTAAEPEQRAIAAYVISYAPDKRKVVDDLQYALQDADYTVRSNAMRALGAIAVLARRDPAAEIRVSPTWMIEMIDSVFWTDRNNAVVALVNLTETRDPKLLDHVRERGLRGLTEMARWKHLPHALPSCILLGRVAGWPEDQIQAAWSRGDRDGIVAAAQKSAAKK